MMYSTPRRALHEAATAAVLAGAAAALALPMPSTTEHVSGPVLLILLAATVLVELLPINYPDRAEATLSTLPVILLWYYLGPFAAAVAAGSAITFVHLARRQPSPLLAAAIAIVSIVFANGVSALVLAAAPPTVVETATWLGAAVFGVVYSLFAPLLGLLVLGLRQGPFEPISGLTMTPVAIALIELVVQRSSQDMVSPALLGLLLASFGGIILLVRSNVNVLTLNRQVNMLAARNEEIAQALAVERDALAAIVAFSGDGIFTIDRQLKIERFNPALAALTGVREESAVGRGAADVLGPAHAAATVGAVLQTAAREGRTVRIGSTVASPEGQRELTTTYSAIPDLQGGIALGVGVVRDVTQEREEARIREDYFSLVTHDLRNPLTGVVNYTHLLQKEIEHTSNEDAPARRYVGLLAQSNDRLLRLVENLLELQRIESTHDLLKTEPVALEGLLGEIVDEFRPTAAEHDQRLALTPALLTVQGDPVWVREIVSNLLSNAIKYTPNGGAIAIAAEATGPFASIAVSDTGYGLVPEELDKLFTKFFRSKRPEMRQTRGSGLGLALAKSMAARMGGNITVRSTVGAGSTFTIVLPLATASGSLPPQSSQPDDDAREGLENFILSLSQS